MYDVIIIGAGVVGSFVARTLSKYDLNVLVIEKNNDVGDETSMANSAIVHSGYDPHVGTLKAKLNVLGNKMFDQVCEELDVSMQKIGSITIAINENQIDQLYELLENGKQNGVDVRILEKDELFEMEPFATKKAIKALLAKDAGIINPFELVVALMENAMDNGVKLHLNEKVIDIKKANNYLVQTDKDTYETKVVINAAGVYSDEINNMIMNKKEQILPRRGQYYVLDHFSSPYVTHTLFSLPTERGKGVLVSPTTSGNYLVGPSSDFIDDKEDKDTTSDVLASVISQAYDLVDYLPMKEQIREFSGIRAYHQSGDFVINEKDGFINLLGIQSPGLASSPAIALEALELVKKNLTLKEKNNYNPLRRKVIRPNKLSNEERNQLIKDNPDYGLIVCHCEKVSLGEIKDAIHRNAGAHTIKGVKKRVRAGFGRCQGGYCQAVVADILAKELKIKFNDVLFSNNGSNILDEEIGGQKDEK